MNEPAAPVRLVQIVPEVRIGSGVEAVAYHLEREWESLGVPTTRFTLADAAGGWLPAPGPGIKGKLVLGARVVWFSTVGSLLARRMLRRAPSGTVAICHNDALAGDVYVNHGVIAAAMQARGQRALRMLRNPLHLFVHLRDTLRYATATHRVVVNLCQSEQRALARTYPTIRPRTQIIGNGVDIDRFRPDAAVRDAVRRELDITPDATVALFVGHEFDRKGLPQVLEALRETPEVRLIVVGGTAAAIDDARQVAARADVLDRVSFVGRQPDPVRYFQASDMFVFPSAYEAYPLVVLEALASGLPVIATAVGSIPEVIQDGVNGALVERTEASVASGLRRVASGNRIEWATAARASAEQHSWSAVAGAYLSLAEELAAARDQERRRS